MKIETIKYMIMAQDMNRAVQFYTKTVGLSVRFQSDMWTELQWEGSTVALHGGWDGKVNRTGLSFQVQDIRTACEEAKAAGATVLRAPEERAGEPIILADLRDPEGNEVMFSQYKG
ncbi:MAG: VOC family protein [Pseudobdellovibrionaceae bacterium]